jgi:hypothetical protein
MYLLTRDLELPEFVMHVAPLDFGRRIPDADPDRRR